MSQLTTLRELSRQLVEIAKAIKDEQRPMTEEEKQKVKDLERQYEQLIDHYGE